MDPTPPEWVKIRTIARTLAPEVDRNEVGKIAAYVRKNKHSSTAKQDLLELLAKLPLSNFIRTQKTKEYFGKINETCRQELQNVPDARIALIMCWAFRIMTHTRSATNP